MIKTSIKRALARLDLALYRPSRVHGGYDEFDVSFLPDVDVVFDIGVAQGTPWLYERFPRAELVLVDPVEKLPDVDRVLAGRPHTFVQCALGAKTGEVDFHVNVDRPMRSSALERTALTRTDDRYETRTVEVTTLDDLVATYVPDGATFGVKIDTEGYELEVLRGATRSLEQCAFVLCEASVQERFEDSYRLEDLVCHLKGHGFGVRSVLTAERDPEGVIRFVDLAFTPLERP